jgi:tetraprenyl-beta-curcumene synthase
MLDPLPLSPRQVWVLVAASSRQLFWGLGAASLELSACRLRALAIPDAPIREDALTSLDSKRGHADGAALFAILPPRRDLNLIRLLVRYQTIWDFLDCVNERAAGEGTANGRQLHLALVEALDPGAPMSDYYRFHPWQNDGGYLNMLVRSCRRGCALLPSYGRVRSLVVREARRAQVLALNHDTDPCSRDAALQRWAARECADRHSHVDWFELSSAASASLTVLAFLALASQPSSTEAAIRRTCAAYFPWISGAATMLDSFVDQAEDRRSGDHRYVSHYTTPDMAEQRLSALVHRSAAEARRLPGGHRHAVIAACMVAMYLSKDSAKTPEMQSSAAKIAGAGGSLTRLLLPVLRMWRIAFAQQGA